MVSNYAVGKMFQEERSNFKVVQTASCLVSWC